MQRRNEQPRPTGHQHHSNRLQRKYTQMAASRTRSNEQRHNHRRPERRQLHNSEKHTRTSKPNLPHNNTLTTHQNKHTPHFLSHTSFHFSLLLLELQQIETALMVFLPTTGLLNSCTDLLALRRSKGSLNLSAHFVGHHVNSSQSTVHL